MVERLNRLLGVFKGDDRVLIIINADPDAIASAMALKRLLWRRVASVTTARTNIIKRPDNLAMIEYARLPLVHFNDVSIKDYTRLATVDGQPHHQDCVKNLTFNVVIDHHPLGSNGADFLDVRPTYGATSTIMTEYLRAARIIPSKRLATALFYGIKTDTSDFARQGQIEDMRAFRFLFPLINQNRVSKIENAELTRSDLKYFKKGLERVKTRKDRALAFLGRVDNPDTLVLLADFFMRIHDINRSIVAGVCKDKLVVIFRVVGPRQDAGRMAAGAFGQFGPAGGHRSMGRAEMPLANLDPKLVENEAALERFIVKRLQYERPKGKGVAEPA